MKNAFWNLILIIAVVCISLITTTAEGNDDLINLPVIAELDVDGYIRSADFSPDDRHIVTKDSKGNISIWNAASGSLLISWYENRAGNSRVIYSPNGYEILSQNSLNLNIWDTETGKLNRTFEYKYSVTDSIYNNNGTIIYGIQYNDVVYLDSQTGEILTKIAFTEKPTSLAYNSALEHLAIGLPNGDISIRDAKTGDYIQTIPSEKIYDSRITKNLVRYDNQNEYLFRVVGTDVNNYGYASHNILHSIHKVNDDYEIKELNSEEFSGYKLNWFDFDISPNDKYLAGYGWGKLIIFNTNSKSVISEMRFNDYSHSALTFDKNGNRLIANNVILDISVLPDRELEAIRINRDSSIMLPGQLQTLNVTALYTDGTEKNINFTDVNWTSTNPSVAKFTYGKLEALELGVTTIKAQYEGHTASINIHVQNYREEKKQENIEVDKVWNVKFSKPVDIHTIKEKNIYITDENNTIIPILYYIEKGQESIVQLIPVKDYTKGASYTLWIKDVNSASGDSVKEFVKMEFTIKN